MPKLTLDLDEVTLAKLVKVAEESGYSKVEDFLKFLIEEAISAYDVSLDEKEVEEIKERLRRLGYVE